MKNIIVLLGLMFLASCSLIGDSDEVIDAKKELLGEEYIATLPEEDREVEEKEEVKKLTEEDVIIDNNKEEVEITNETPIVDNNSSENVKIEQSYASEEKYFELEEIGTLNANTEGFEIKGTTDLLLDKIVISFSNKDSGLPDDRYELQTFKTGDKSFLYRAFRKYDVLGVGLNTYTIEAYFGDKVSKQVLEVYLPESDENIEKTTTVEEVETVAKTIGGEEDGVYLSLPETDDSGSVLMLGEDSFTYANIDGLEVNKYSNASDLTCDNLTDYLIDTYGWAYWNTCRPVNTDKGISYFVLRLSGDDYFYEKHYLDYIHGLYGVLLLEKGTGIDGNNISDKNSEFKTAEFGILEKVDPLFTKIIK